MLPRLLPRLLFAAMALAAVLFTPASSGFALRPDFVCETDASADIWLFSLTNVRHIVTFAILGATAIWAFGTQRIWIAVAATLLVTAGVELSQAIFAEGHCRLRDGLPNLVAVALGVGIALLIARIVERSAARRT